MHTLQRLHELADASLRRLGRGGGRLRLGARGGGVLLGRRELTGGDERVGLGLEEFLESRLQASVGLCQRGVFGAGHAQVQLALAPRRAKLRLGGASFVKRQAFLRRAGHLLHVQLEFILLLSRLRLLGDGGLERLRQAHLANLQHGQPRVRRGQRLLQAALRAGFESLHERLRVVRLYAVRLRLRLGAARALLQRRALRHPTSLGAHVFAIQRRSRRPHLRHRLFVLGHVRHELFELILLGVEVLDERREGAIRRRAFFPGAPRLRRARLRRRRLRVRARRRRETTLGTLGRRRAHRAGGP